MKTQFTYNGRAIAYYHTLISMQHGDIVKDGSISYQVIYSFFNLDTHTMEIVLQKQ